MLIQLGGVSAAYHRVIKNAVHSPDGQVTYRCSVHGPMWGHAVRAPQHSCEECWIMWAKKLEAVTPPAKRRELFENLSGLVAEAVRLAEKGQFDLEIYRSPKVEIDLTD